MLRKQGNSRNYFPEPRNVIKNQIIKIILPPAEEPRKENTLAQNSALYASSTTKYYKCRNMQTSCDTSTTTLGPLGLEKGNHEILPWQYSAGCQGMDTNNKQGHAKARRNIRFLVIYVDQNWGQSWLMQGCPWRFWHGGGWVGIAAWFATNFEGNEEKPKKL